MTGFPISQQALPPMSSQIDRPDYVALFEQIAATADPVERENLLVQVYTFISPLEDFEKTLFDYMISGYVEKNPGMVGNTFSSYVGVYVNQEGEFTGELE
jgi:hypothetical protein